MKALKYKNQFKPNAVPSLWTMLLSVLLAQVTTPKWTLHHFHSFNFKSISDVYLQYLSNSQNEPFSKSIIISLSTTLVSK